MYPVMPIPGLRALVQLRWKATMSSQNKKAIQFHALHVPGRPLILFNCWDAGSAKAIAASGAGAIATASWAVAAANGYPDGEHLPLDIAIDNAARIVAAVELPVTIDLESGYGIDPDTVAATVARAIEAGAVGCNLEDSDPASGGIRAAQEQGRRLAAVRAIAQDFRFFINARADAFLKAAPLAHDAAMLDEVTERAHVYAANGADGLFVPGLVDPGLIGQLVRASPLPVNLMRGANTPPLNVLAELGVARVSHGPGPYRQMMKALEDAARAAIQG